jgi:hypothetical protein
MPAKRNPAARAVRSPRYRPRVKASRKRYVRARAKVDARRET